MTEPGTPSLRLRMGESSINHSLGLQSMMRRRNMAEFDAWYVFGVDKVLNRLEIHP